MLVAAIEEDPPKAVLMWNLVQHYQVRLGRVFVKRHISTWQAVLILLFT
jgi:hypothetical protein